MRRVFFLMLMVSCASLVGVGDLLIAPDATTSPTCGSPGPADGMVGYFPFDEDAGACAMDCVLGTLPACTPDDGSAMWVSAGWHGGAISVTSSEGCMRVGEFSTLDQSTFSLSVWVHATSIPSTYGAIVTRHANSNVPGWDLVANDIDAAHNVQFRVFAADAAVAGAVATPGLFVNSGWQHIIVTYVPGGASTIRIDDASATANLPPILATQTALVIGCRGLNDYEFNGSIDEVRLYDHVLSAQELADLEK